MTKGGDIDKNSGIPISEIIEIRAIYYIMKVLLKKKYREALEKDLEVLKIGEVLRLKEEELRKIEEEQKYKSKKEKAK